MSGTSPFRLRTYGPRCASPPTYVCYELPQSEPQSRCSSPTSSDDGDSEGDCDNESDINSNSDDEDSSSSKLSSAPERMKDDSAPDVVVAEEAVTLPSPVVEDVTTLPPPPAAAPLEPKDIPCPPSGSESEGDEDAERRREEKRLGKMKEVVEGTESQEPAPIVVDAVLQDSPAIEIAKPKQKKRKTRRRPRDDYVPEVRPILTIRSSQGFVWNQDLFLSPWDKSRYIATSPPSSLPSRGTPEGGKSNLVTNNNFFSTSGEADFEVECVEIHVDEGEMDGIIPRG